jgi:hypothetical protein
MKSNSEHESQENKQENEATRRDMQKRKHDRKIANLGVPTPGQGAIPKRDNAQQDDEARADSGGQDSYERGDEPKGGENPQNQKPGSMPGPGPH